MGPKRRCRKIYICIYNLSKATNIGWCRVYMGLYYRILPFQVAQRQNITPQMWTTRSIKQILSGSYAFSRWVVSKIFVCFYSYLGRWSDLNDILFSNGLKPIDIWLHDVSYSWCNERSSLVMERLSVVKEWNQQQAMINKKGNYLGVYSEIWYIYIHVFICTFFIYYTICIRMWNIDIIYIYTHHVYCMCLSYSRSYFP